MKLAKRLMMRQSGGGLWTPAQISKLLWLDAADAATITLNGSAVSQWADKSEYNRHATQGTAANQPTYQPTGFNNLPAISFDGSDDYLNLVQFAQVSGQNIFAVIDTTNIGTSWRAFLERSSGSESNMALLLGTDTGYEPAVYWNYSGRAKNADTLRKAIFRWSFTTGSSASALTQVDDAAPVTQTFTASALTNWAAINASSGPQNCNIRLCELIMTPTTPDTTTLAKIQGYLAHRWGLTANLATGHPYKTSAP